MKTSIKNSWSVKTLKFSVNNLYSIVKQYANSKIEIHSPICTVFAFDSDISVKNCKSEWRRFIDMVEQFNKVITENSIDIPNVVTPISSLCVAKSIAFDCKNALKPTDESSWNFCFNDSDSFANVIRFITFVVDTCTIYSYERNALFLENYIDSK